MKKEISVVHTNLFIDCVREIKGEKGVSFLLSNLIGNPKFLIKNDKTGEVEPVNLQFLKNPNNWVSNEFSLKTFEEAARILGGSRPVFHIGRMMVRRKLKGARGPLVKLILTSSPEVLLKKIAGESRTLNRTKDYHLISLEKNRAVVRLVYFPGIRVHKNICDYNMGGFVEGFKQVTSESQVVESKCVTKGDPYCEFVITWKSKNIVDQFLDLTVRRYKILKEVKEELEEEHERSLDLVFNLEEKVKQRTDELNKRNKELEQAYKEIKKLSDAKSLFLADASHELRTPLAVFKGNIEMLKKLNLKKSESDEVLELVDDTADRMTKLVSELITLAAADFRKNSLHKNIISLDSIVKKVCNQLDNLASSKNIRLTSKNIKKIDVFGNEDKLIELIMNILENAIKYTEAGGKVTASMYLKDEFAVVKVSDSGVGIPKEEVPKIFDRFYRVDKSRSKEIGGNGLGLTICKWIAQAHKGEIDVESVEGEGSNFYIKLPVLK